MSDPLSPDDEFPPWKSPVETPPGAPDPDDLAPGFAVYEVETDGKTVRYYGDLRASPETVIERAWGPFRERGYEARLTHERGEFVLIAEPIELGVNGIPWTNVFLFVATILSTLYAGAHWYYVDPFSTEIVQAVPFMLAIMIVLGVHELGHYVMSRYHGVQASLPYFIPIPTIIGTMGAVIKMEGQMPDRDALFDIGVAGPLAGLAATIVVTAVGLHMDPVTPPPEIVDGADVYLELGYPPLLELIAAAVGQPLAYDGVTSVNPVVVGGWVGMFVTFLNLIPVGQLDGGHIVRAMAGQRQQTIAAVVPLVLVALAAYVHYLVGASLNAAGLWLFWALVAVVLATVGPAHPVRDEPLDAKRKVVGALTFVLGALCFTPVPIDIVYA